MTAGLFPFLKPASSSQFAVNLAHDPLPVHWAAVLIICVGLFDVKSLSSQSKPATHLRFPSTVDAASSARLPLPGS